MTTTTSSSSAAAVEPELPPSAPSVCDSAAETRSASQLRGEKKQSRNAETGRALCRAR